MTVLLVAIAILVVSGPAALASAAFRRWVMP
jgi:hypothetical protein